MPTPNVRHAKVTPRASCEAPPSTTTSFAFEYHDGQSGERTSHAQRTSGAAGVSISFAT